MTLNKNPGRTRRAQIGQLFGRCDVHRKRRSFPDFHDYRLEREIGHGNRGTVYLAHRKGTSFPPVAIKLLRGLLDRETRMRFRREAFCASSVRHPNVVGVLHVLESRYGDAIVMEYVRGKALARLIPEDGLPLATCLSYALQIAEALAAVHLACVIHRDLKPGNVVVTKDGIIKLLDFGLAKRFGNLALSEESFADVVTIDGTILGTLGYMSPEQVLGQPIDVRSDIFSFGSLFYEMLTGHRAFREQNAKFTMDAILEKQPDVPSRLPRQVAEVVERCLAKDRSTRYQTCAELLNSLRIAILEIGIDSIG